MDFEITAGVAHVLVFVLVFYSVRIERRTKEIERAISTLASDLKQERQL